jgi:hypothetical protein
MLSSEYSFWADVALFAVVEPNFLGFNAVSLAVFRAVWANSRSALRLAAPSAFIFSTDL